MLGGGINDDNEDNDADSVSVCLGGCGVTCGNNAVVVLLLMIMTMWWY